MVFQRSEVGLFFIAGISATLLLASVGSEADKETSRYFLYSVKTGEGFNLRRDVHMRAATLVKELGERSGEKWTLVLPPWPILPHWRTARPDINLKWELFFDLPSLNEYVPTIEFSDYVDKEGKKVDKVRTVLDNLLQFSTLGHHSKKKHRHC